MTPGAGARRAVAFVHAVALAIALGGPIVFAAIVAPSALRALPAGSAGVVIGETLQTLSVGLQGAFAVLFATTLSITRGAGRNRLALVARRAPVRGFFCAVVTASLVVPPMARLRATIGDPGSRALFDRLHATSVMLLLLEIACSLVVLWATLPVAAAPATEVPAPPRLP